MLTASGPSRAIDGQQITRTRAFRVLGRATRSTVAAISRRNSHTASRSIIHRKLSVELHQRNSGHHVENASLSVATFRFVL